MMKKIIQLSLVALSCMPLYTAHAIPAKLTFNNHTPLALASSVNGLPGQGVAPSVSKTVSYVIVNVGCSYGGKSTNCPIEFTDKSNGALVATVYMNAETATLNQPPIFHNDYGNEYEVLGWDASPVTEITISKKA